MDRAATHVAAAEDEHRPGAPRRWAEAFGPAAPPRLPAELADPDERGHARRAAVGCVVLPIEDSLRSIFAALGDAALVHPAGGGTGYTFTHLRPAGDRVASTGGTASGPVSFLRVFDTAACVLRAGGRRRSANMAVLDATHPDVVEFVDAKRTPGELEHFNLSVAVPDRFLRAVERGGTHRLVNPDRPHRRPDVARSCSRSRERPACGDRPAVVDAINRANPLPFLGRIEATNPCGEVPCSHESCNPGRSTSPVPRDGGVDWDRLTEVALAVRFLDDVIDAGRYPTPSWSGPRWRPAAGRSWARRAARRPAHPYDSDEAVRLPAAHPPHPPQAHRRRPLAASGLFPFEQSTFARRARCRCATQLTSIAPTGTICSSPGRPRASSRCSHRLRPHRLGHQWSSSTRCSSAPSATWASTRPGCRPGRRHRAVRDDPVLPPDIRAAFPTALRSPPSGTCGCRPRSSATSTPQAEDGQLPADATVEDVREIYFAARRA